MRKILVLSFVFLLGIFVVSGFTIKKANASTSAECMIVIERSSGRVLDEKNADKKRPMASTTKIATAITVLENCEDIDKKVKVPKEAVGVEGSSIYLEEGEELSIRDLLYGLMLQSGNDCAVALAVLTSGNVTNFAIRMNKIATKVGAVNTNFTNPHGLHDDNHYTTARDLALITAYAMSNPVFREIVSTKRYEMPWANRDYKRVVVNKNKILSTYEGGNGVKTGYTKKAGRCLVASSKRNGMEVVAVVLNCSPMFEDCRSLMDKAHLNYNLVDLSLKIPKQEMKVNNGKEKSVELKIKDEPLLYPLTLEEQKTVKYEVLDITDGSAPVKKGQENGKIRITLENHLLFERKFYTIKEVDCLSLVDYMGEIVDKWCG